MPESLLTQKLRYLHALWQDPNTTTPTGLAPDGDVLQAYRKACEDQNSDEAVKHLGLIRDTLLD